MNISVIGCGRWGCFLAWYLDRIGHKVTLYGRKNSKRLENLINTRKNKYMTIGESIHLTSDLESCIQSAEYLLISISAQNLRQFSQDIMQYDIDNKPFVLCMKGLEETTGMRLSNIVKEYIGDRAKIAVWVGPGHVEDFVNSISNCMVIDSEHEDLKKKLVDAFSGD
ncbi:MAG: glycerol-3-phosphate dehydrogenase, partial [Clostridiales bacterium]|nr:glycerol-3-phosphate dehydrogenase [Clostridiales bacterium]